jgi:hydrogenase-4 component E
LENYSVVLSSLILLSAFVLVASKRIHSYIGVFRAQAVLIALNTGLLGVREFLHSGRVDILAVFVVLVVLKVIYIPRVLHRTYAAVEYKVEKDFFLNIPTLVLLCSALVVLVYAAVSSIAAVKDGNTLILLVDALSAVLIGLVFLISRKKAVGQIVGLLAIENGLFVTALYASDGMPFIVDMGIFIDLVTAVLILGLMVFRIDEAFDSTDTDRMSDLKG